MAPRYDMGSFPVDLEGEEKFVCALWSLRDLHYCHVWPRNGKSFGSSFDLHHEHSFPFAGSNFPYLVELGFSFFQTLLDLT